MTIFVYFVCINSNVCVYGLRKSAAHFVLVVLQLPVVLTLRKYYLSLLTFYVIVICLGHIDFRDESYLCVVHYGGPLGSGVNYFYFAFAK